MPGFTPKKSLKLPAVFFLLLSLSLSAGCAGLISSNPPTPTPIPASASLSAATFTVKRGEIINAFNFRGQIVPVTQQSLAFHSSGVVRKVYVSRDDMIKTGQVLADLEIGDLENQLAQARVNLQGAQARLAFAQQTLSDDLADAQIALQIEQLRLDQAKYELQINGGTAQKIAEQIQEQVVKLAELKVARRQRGVDASLSQDVSLAQLTVDRLQAQVDASTLLAPFDGQVLMINIDQGQVVTAFSQVVMVVCDPTHLEVGANPDPGGLAQMAEGLAVVVKLNNQAKGQIQGVVRSLPYPYGKGAQSASTEDYGNVATRITLDQDAAQGGYKLGDLVDVQVVLQDKKDVLWLPPEAIRNYEGRRFVVVQQGEGQQRVNVTIGIQTEQRVEITDGLSEGQVIVGQ